MVNRFRLHTGFDNDSEMFDIKDPRNASMLATAEEEIYVLAEDYDKLANTHATLASEVEKFLDGERTLDQLKEALR